MLEMVLDNWSLILLCTQPLLYVWIVPPLTCIIFRLKTPSKHFFLKIISLVLITLTTPVTFSLYYISSNTGPPELQRAFIRQVQHTSEAHWCPQHLQNDGRFGCRKTSGQDSRRRRGVVQWQNLSLENSHVRTKSVFNPANMQLKEIPANKELCHYIMNNLLRMKSQENMSKTKTCVRSKSLKQSIQISNEKKQKRPPYIGFSYVA